MISNYIEFQPDYIIHPGEYIAELIESKALKQTEIAIRMGISLKHLNNIIKGKAAISPPIANSLQNVLGYPSIYWLNLQANYDIFMVENSFIDDYNKNKQEFTEWLAQFDYQILVNDKYFDEKYKSNSDIDKIKNLLLFFECSNINSWNDFYKDNLPAVCRISGKRSQKLGNTLSWIKKGQLVARSRINNVEKYKQSNFKNILNDLRNLTISSPPNLAQSMIDLCRSVGVILIFQKEIPRSSICGAAFWINDGTIPCILLNLRFKTNDHFWFAFFHEVAHILKEHKKTLFIDADYSNIDEMEEDANNISSNILIPKEKYLKFIKGAITKTTIMEFSDSIGIHPGIVIGRLQHDKKLNWNMYNDLKQHLRWA